MSIGTDKSSTDRRPVDPSTEQPIGPLAQPGYYPGYSTLSQQAFWEEATRKVVLERLHNVPPIRFFNAEQAALLLAVCDRIIPQDDRDEAHKIPIVARIDDRLYNNTHDGYRYADMPPDRQAYILGLQGIDATAYDYYGRLFIQLGPGEQERVLESLHHGKPEGGKAVWSKMPVERFWTLLVSDCINAYYAHPFAWDEIGYGGPAYPRAYMRLENGQPEPWETDEARYEWQAPVWAVSDQYKLVAGHAEHHGAPEGTG